MKKGAIFILLFAFLILQISMLSADLITIGQSGGGEMSVGSTPISTSIARTPPATTPPVTTPPSSGGGGTTEVKTFTLDKSFLAVEVRRGETYQEQITITNDKTTDLTIDISIIDIGKFLFPEEETLVLQPGQSKTINFNIYFSENQPIDVYLGKILFTSASTSKFVNVVLDVKEKSPLFDIRTTVLKKRIAPGKKVTAEIEILNLGDLKNIDVELEYYIRDFNNNSYTSKKESFAIQDEFDGKVFLHAPESIEAGTYIFYSKVKYNNITATSYDTFTIVEVSTIELLTNSLFLTITASLIFLLIILFLVIIILKRRTNGNRTKKVQIKRARLQQKENKRSLKTRRRNARIKEKRLKKQRKIRRKNEKIRHKQSKISTKKRRKTIRKNKRIRHKIKKRKRTHHKRKPFLKKKYEVKKYIAPKKIFIVKPKPKKKKEKKKVKKVLYKKHTPKQTQSPETENRLKKQMFRKLVEDTVKLKKENKI